MSRFLRESVYNTSSDELVFAADYAYDVNNNINRIGVTSGKSGSTMTFTYGTDNLPQGYSGAGGIGAYGYDKLNRLTNVTNAKFADWTYEYVDIANLQTTTLVKNEISNDNSIGSVSYEYDKNGNITKKILTYQVNGVTCRYENIYTYDELNRLIVEQNHEQNQTIKYKYDAWGNIAMKWLYSGSNTFAPDSANLIKKYDYVYSSSTEGMAWKDLMTKYDGKTVTYDSIGNPTSYMGSTMYWEGRTLLEQVKNGTTITYSYDSSDMRTSKTVGGVKHNYYYVEGKLMYEDCPSYKLFYTYDANGFLSGIKRVKSNGVTENFGVHCNIFGDVIAVYFDDGMLAATYTYDSWGQILSVTDPYGVDVMGENEIWTQNSIRYRGYVYDEETGLYYLQSRYYDPEICRFINADNYKLLFASPTALSDKNIYAYCDCNPIIRRDLQGKLWETIVDVISLSSSIIEVYINPTDPWAWAGLVGDTIDIIPVLTGVGETARAVRIINKANNASESISDAHTGWKLGDNVTKLTSAGNVPTWTTVRKRYWKNEALLNPHKYSDIDLYFMRKNGYAPKGIDGLPIELHHPYGRKSGDNFFIFYPMSHTDHFILHYGE